MSLHRNCAGVTRRDCLKLGLEGIVAGGLVGALRSQAMANSGGDASGGGRPAQAKACILIWMDGGPSHYETFDPKPQAPVEIRGQYHPIATKLPGVHFSQHMQRLADIADRTTVIRSICHNQGNHGAGNHYMMTGSPPRIPVGCGAFVSFHPSMGSVASRECSSPPGLPPYFSLPSMTRSGGPSFLGAEHAPFVVGGDPNSANFQIRDVAVPRGLTNDRFLQRRELRQLVDRMTRIEEEAAADPVRAGDEFYQQGYQLVTSTDAQRAFDINQESDAVRDRYGRNGFGQRALLSRRLVEAGVPFITINDGGWDHHGNLFGAFDKRMPDWDNTVATLIEDLDERGLLDTTLVIALGEFGRTPQINKDGGRDHWSNAMSVLFAGGGTPRGQVIGATDPRGYAAVERVLSPENFVSTIYTKLGMDLTKHYYTQEGRPTLLVSDPTPIPELMG